MSDEIKKDRIITDETLRETASHGSEEYSATIMRTSGISTFTVSTGTGTQRSNLFMYKMARLIFWWVETGMFSALAMGSL